MNILFRAVSTAAVAVVLLSGCTGTPQPVGGPTTSPATSAAPDPTTSDAPTDKPTASATTKNQPVPKVQRSGEAKATITAKPVDTDGKVTYSDGVRLVISAVKFGKETKEGPGRFPGRAFAILSLEVDNGSKKALSLDTVVVTVLDRAGKPVNPVYVEEAKVSDFNGELKAGATAKARYAFAVPVKSRSKVTVVVDFDGVHTSAVFRGGLS